MTTRERLLDTTRDLLWEHGYSAVSPRMILDASGVGQGSLYHHFSGKPALAAAALELSAAEMRATGAETLDRPGTAVERISAYLLRDRDALRGCRIGRMTQDAEAMADDSLRAPVAQTLAWYRSRVGDVLTEGQQTGELVDTFSPDRVAAAIVATVQGGYVLAKAAQAREPFDDAVAGAIELLHTLEKAAA